jgi:F420-non-reducing hydrogenase iron-sulfur subunit
MTAPHAAKAQRAAQTPKAASRSGGFTPRIIAFCCENSSYAAADLAGAARLSYPVNVEIIRVPCAGRVDPMHVLHALNGGADGVMVASCMKEQCNYVSGNLYAEKRMTQLGKWLEAIGFGGRLDFQMMGAGMAQHWVDATQQFVARIVQLGPNPMRRRRVEAKQR